MDINELIKQQIDNAISFELLDIVKGEVQKHLKNMHHSEMVAYVREALEALMARTDYVNLLVQRSIQEIVKQEFDKKMTVTISVNKGA